MKRILAMLCVISVLFSFTACSNADGRHSEGDENQQIQVDQRSKETTGASENESKTLESDVPAPSNSDTDLDTSIKNNDMEETPQENTATINQTEKNPVTGSAASSESKPSEEQPTEKQPPSQTETSKQPESSSTSKPETPPETKPETKPEMQPETQPEPPVTEEDDNMLIIEIVVGSKTFTATLYDNEAAKALVERLPLTLNMSELNGNEKYYYLDSNFPTNSSRPSGIKTGDIMLYGNNCLVLFYESFSTSYSYTPLGHIDDPEGLAAALGSGSVQVTFQKG